MKKKISLRVIRRISFYYEALLKLNLPENTYISSKKLEEVTGRLLQPGAPGFLLPGHFHRQAEKRLPGQEAVPRAEKDPLHRPRRPGDHHRRRPHRPGPVQLQAVQGPQHHGHGAVRHQAGAGRHRDGQARTEKAGPAHRPAGGLPEGESRHSDRPADRPGRGGPGDAGQADHPSASREWSISPPRS